MTRSTLTTVVTTPETFSLLLNVTDELVNLGLLDSLRVVDQTSNFEATNFLRSIIPFDGDTGSAIVTLDRDIVSKVDPSAHVLMGMTGYRYKSTDLRLVPGGRSVYVLTRGSQGSFIAVSHNIKSGGVEIGLEKNKCYVRGGRGGGSIISEIEISGIVAGGQAWRALELSVDINNNLVARMDNGAVLFAQLTAELKEFFVSVTSPALGLSDFIVTQVNHENFVPESRVDRKYISYYSKMPIPVKDGIEIRSELDIVYIEKEGWKKMLKGEASPLVWCEPENLSIFRRLGVLKKSDSVKDSHVGFFNRSNLVVERVKNLGLQNVPVMLSETTRVKVEGSSGGLVPPAFICALDGECVKDQKILDGYKNLLVDGLQGEILTDYASDVLAYLDVLLNTKGTDEFLYELVEALPRNKREILFKLLSERLR